MIEEDLAGYPILLKCPFLVHAQMLSGTSYILLTCKVVWLESWSNEDKHHRVEELL